MRNVNSIALAALSLMAAAIEVSPVRTEPEKSKPLNRKGHPVEKGPVIDSTPESKRARRRRLAKNRDAP